MEIWCNRLEKYIFCRISLPPVVLSIILNLPLSSPSSSLALAPLLRLQRTAAATAATATRETRATAATPRPCSSRRPWEVGEMLLPLPLLLLLVELE